MKLKMIQNSYTLIFIVLMLIPPLTMRGQDPQSSQAYAAPMYLNPAFTGNTIQSRVSANYRKQWIKVPGAFTSYSFSYDQFLRKYRSGVGLTFVNDKAGSGALRHNSIGGLYSYVFQLSRNVGIRAGVRASYVIRALDFNKLTFADQIIRQDPSNTIETFDRLGKSYADFATGAVLFWSSGWLGCSFDHLNRPNEPFQGQDARLPIKYTMQGGYRFVLTEDVKGNSVKDITTSVIYKGQQDWDQLDIGAYYQYKVMIAGIWYRGLPGFKSYKRGYSNNDAVVLMLGLRIKDYVHFGYSYDITISKLGVGTQGSHELALIYEFAQPEYKRNGKKQKFMVPCSKITFSQ